MEMFSLVATLDDPWKAKLLDFLHAVDAPSWTFDLGGRILVAAEATSVDGDCVDVELFRFFPGKGFSLAAKDRCRGTLVIPDLQARPINMFPGAQFMCHGPAENRVDGKVFHFNRDVAVATRPEFCRDMHDMERCSSICRWFWRLAPSHLLDHAK